MSGRKKAAVFGLVVLVLLTGCLHGGGGENAESGEDATVAVAVGMSEETEQELSEAQQEAQQQVLEDLNDSENAMYQEAQQAQMAGGELNDSQSQLLERIQQDAQDAQSDAEEDAEQSRQETLDDLENNISESEDLELVDSVEVQGQSLLLVSGSSNGVLGLLDQPGVQGILPQQQFEQIKEQQEQQQEQGGLPGGGQDGNTTE